MKKWIILWLFMMVQITTLIAQQEWIHFEKKDLASVFKQLEEQYELIFAFDQEAIAPLLIKKSRYKANDVDDLLDQILPPLQLSYRITAQKYVLVKKMTAEELSVNLKEEEKKPSVCGYLIDATTGDPLPYGNVLLSPSDQGTASNEQGFFSLMSNFSSSDTLKVSYIGYQSVSIHISEILDQPCKKIPLKTVDFSFAEILIKDYSISFLKPSRQGLGIQLNPDQMGRLPGWGENDVLRMVQLLPGIHSSNESAADIHIRGGTPDQNLILWEDIPILHLGHFFGMFTAVNPNISKSIKVFPGNFDASQGGRVSGLIDIRGPDAIDSLSGNFTLNLINAQAYLNLPIIKEQASLQLAFRRSYTDFIQSLTYKKLFDQVAGNGKIEDNQQQASQEELEALLSPTFYFNDFNAKWDWTMGSRTRWTSSFYRGSDHLDYLVLFDEPYFYLRSDDEIDLSNTGASTVLSHEWSPRLQSNLKWIYSGFRNEYRFNLDIRPQDQLLNSWRYSQNNRLEENGLQWNNSWVWYPGQSLNFGYHRSAYGVNFRVDQQTPDEEPKQFEENINGTLHSMYLDFDINFKDRLLVDFGLRHIRYTPYRNFLLLPRLSVNYQPFTKWPLQIKGSVGRYTQFMNQMITDNELGLSEQIWIIAGEEQGLPLVQANQWSVGLRFQKKGWIVESEYYEKETFNLTSLNLQFGELQDNPYSLGQADIRGFDLLVRKKWHHFNTWLSWSIGRVKYQFPGINGGIPFYADHDQRHTLKWTNLLEYSRWGVSLSWFYNTGRPFTLPESVDTYFNTEKQEWEYILNIPTRNEQRLSPYQRLDLSVYWRWPVSKEYSFIGGLAIFNALNRKNIRDKKYYLIPPDENGVRPAQLFKYDQPALSFTPNLFIELRW